MGFREFVKASTKRRSPDSLIKLFQKELHRFGFEKFFYGIARSGIGSPKINHSYIFRNYPNDWIRNYIDTNRKISDARYRFLLSTNQIFTWKRIKELMPMSKAEVRMIDEVNSIGLRSGVSVPIYCSHNNIFGMSMASSMPDRILRKTELLELSAIVNQFHLVHFALHNSENINTLTPLTHRQREILLWIASGKSTSGKSDLMHISESTVEDHMRKIFRKFKCNNRTVAVLKAMSVGLLDA